MISPRGIFFYMIFFFFSYIHINKYKSTYYRSAGGATILKSQSEVICIKNRSEYSYSFHICIYIYIYPYLYLSIYIYVYNPRDEWTLCYNDLLPLNFNRRRLGVILRTRSRLSPLYRLSYGIGCKIFHRLFSSVPPQPPPSSNQCPLTRDSSLPGTRGRARGG